MGRKKQVTHENHERWLVSYADFITLLFAFFVVMFASAHADKARARQVSESVREALENGRFASTVTGLLSRSRKEPEKERKDEVRPSGDLPAPADLQQVELLPSLEYLNRELEEEIRAGKIRVKLEPRGLVVSLRQAAFFPSGEDRIAPDTYPSIEKIAAVIRDLPNSVRLEGHTDSVPIHNLRFHNNWELSVARSIAMLELLMGRFEIPDERLAVAGYAETAPVDSNESAEGRAHNRRVDIVILNQQAVCVEPRTAVRAQPDRPQARRL